MKNLLKRFKEKLPEKEKHVQDIAQCVGCSQMLRFLLPIANNVWRAEKKTTDPLSKEPREEMKSVHRHIDAIRRTLQDMGLEIRDHTDDPYDTGQPMKVIASEPTVGIKGSLVKETLSPTIYLKSQISQESKIVQHGEIIVAEPVEPNVQSS